MGVAGSLGYGMGHSSGGFDHTASAHSGYDSPEQEPTVTDTNMECCDQQQQLLECCEQPQALHTGLSTDRLTQYTDFSTAFITIAVPPSDWLAQQSPVITLDFAQNSRWLMDSYPRPHLVHCTLLD